MKNHNQDISLYPYPKLTYMPISKITGFDPLMTTLPPGDFEGLPDDIFNDAIKSTVQTILKSYTGFFDIFSEAIQNALDATEKKLRMLEDKYTPRVWITISNDSILRVVDNGCGMNLSEFLLCFRPNMTFKRGQNLKGNKGVGATFLAYGYDYVSLQTKVDNAKYGAVLRGGRFWAEDETGKIERPTFEEIAFDVPELQNENSGSCIEIRLSKKTYEKPKEFSWYGAKTAKQWLDMLRVATPLGAIFLEGEKFLPFISIRVIDRFGEETKEEREYGKGVEYYYPHDIPGRKIADLNELREHDNKLGGDLKFKLSKTPDRLKNIEVLYEIWNHIELQEAPYLKLKLTDEEKGLIQHYQICVYGAQVDTLKTFDLVNLDIGINKRKLMQGGILLATDGMPQGEMLVIPITKSVGLQKNTLIIVHFKRGNPDMGRKTFQPELTDLSIKIAKRLTNIFISYKPYLRPDSGEDKMILPDRQQYDWQQRVTNFREQNQLPYKFIPNFTYYCKPQEEQDVIAIFHQLVGAGIIKGLYFYSTEYNEKYDGLFEYFYDNETFYYSSACPLGVTFQMPIPEARSAPKVIEYKFDFSAALEDFENNEKHFEHVGLIVCWRASGEYNQDDLTIKSLLIENEGNIRTIYGSTHVAFLPGLYSRHRIEIIVLEELINFITLPEQEIINQKIKYPL